VTHYTCPGEHLRCPVEALAAILEHLVEQPMHHMACREPSVGVVVCWALWNRRVRRQAAKIHW
jgi:hypothetical protein